jgi:hypothetical protein
LEPITIITVNIIIIIIIIIDGTISKAIIGSETRQCLELAWAWQGGQPKFECSMTPIPSKSFGQV